MISPRATVLVGLGATTVAFVISSAREQKEVVEAVVALNDMSQLLHNILDKHNVVLDEFETIAMNDIAQKLKKIGEK